MNNTLKVYMLSSTDTFDFNDKNMLKLGLYRFTEGQVLNGPPGVFLGYGYAIIFTYPWSDTRIVLAFPYDNVEMYIRSGSNKNWGTHKWHEITLRTITE